MRRGHRNGGLRGATQRPQKELECASAVCVCVCVCVCNCPPAVGLYLFPRLNRGRGTHRLINMTFYIKQVRCIVSQAAPCSITMPQHRRLREQPCKCHLCSLPASLNL